MSNIIKKNIFYLKAFLPAILWAGLIYFLSDQQALPSLKTSLNEFLLKKTAHIFVYFVLYWLTLRGFVKIKKENKPYVWLIVLIICVVYGISDEFHQSMTPGRQATIRDVAFDFLGSSLAMMKKYDII